MFVYDILDKEKVYENVVSDLRNSGIKYRHKRNAVKIEKPERNNKLQQKVFKTPLSRLQFDLVNLSSGALVHVPLFVNQATSYLTKYIDQEGLFRKAGSKTRQREISIRVDNGGILEDKDHHIDVANCLKAFFRELPEPLIPFSYHDLFIRCVLLKKNREQALLLACLLLPSHHLNTLAFFLEFLQKVAAYEEFNKMGIANLAVVIGPNIMPLKETTMLTVQSRLEVHLEIVQLLIKNADKIGILPGHIADSLSPEVIDSTDTELDRSDLILTKSKKKKHRSGSLTRKPHLSASNLNSRVLSGLKKMVGKNNSPLETESTSDPINSIYSHTPSLKVGKKRRVLETVNVETKKKVNLMEIMPETIPLRSRYLFLSPVNNDPNPLKDQSPVQMSRVHKYLSSKVHREIKPPEKMDKGKKVRLSLDRFVSRNRQKAVENGKSESNLFRRRSWSLVSRPLESRKKRRTMDVELSCSSPSPPKISKLNTKNYPNNDLFMDANINLSDIAGEQVSLEIKKSKRPIVQLSRRRYSDNHVLNKSSENYNITLSAAYINQLSKDQSSFQATNGSSNREDDYVKIPKSEYEEIKNRVSAIESRISQEFKSLAGEPQDILTVHSVKKVQSEYEKTLEEASIGNTINADHLARRLSKELKIRRSSESRVIRSPSARKIGVIRRRSQERPSVSKRLNRTSSLYLPERSETHSTRRMSMRHNSFYSNPNIGHVLNEKSEDLKVDSLCSAETNARLDYLQEQLHTLISHTAEHTKDSLSDEDLNLIDDRVLQSVTQKTDLKVRRTSSFHESGLNDDSRYFNKRVKELKKCHSQQSVVTENPLPKTETLSSEKKDEVMTWKDAEKYFKNEVQTTTPVPVTGRASVAKLRTQNAGMVLAKAKLFDETKRTSSCPEVSTSEMKIVDYKEVSRGQSTRLKKSKNSNSSTAEASRREIQQKRKKITSPKNSTNKSNIMKSPSSSPIIKMEVTIVPSQEIHRKHSDRSSILQKENKGMRTPLRKRDSAMIQNTNVNYNFKVNHETPIIKKPLLTKTPKSGKSLTRKLPVEVKRTPLRAIDPIITPRRQSPRNVLRSTHLSSKRFN